jgi:Rrf2 family nitric oxide-sensitive transcriptional repressor
MQLTRFSDYSIRTLIFLGLLPPGELSNVASVAAHYDISRNHVVKVVHQLAQLGYIDSVKGKGGGIRLAIPANRIRLGEVIRHTEGTLIPIDCGAPYCHILPGCRVRGVLKEAMDAFMAVLDRYTLADILDGRQVQLRQFLSLPA